MEVFEIFGEIIIVIFVGWTWCYMTSREWHCNKKFSNHSSNEKLRCIFLVGNFCINTILNEITMKNAFENWILNILAEHKEFMVEKYMGNAYIWALE